MAESQVQLKREEIVGDEVVLSDISPQTNSESVVDLASGLSLDDSLYRLWNAINNKLTRVVNSVNGRSGIVVLSADDVGLGNVDNVSLADIQEWTTEQIANEFKSRQFKLYQTLDDAVADVATNNRSLDGTAFFAKAGITENNDKLSYMGYIYWDDGENKLKKNIMSVNTIGYTDNSLIYNESLVSTSKDFSHGGLGVNIYSGEKALKLRNGINKEDSGLYIDKSTLVTSTYTFDGLYGDGTTGITGGDTTAFLYREDETFSTTDPDVFEVVLKYDGTKMHTNKLYTKTPLVNGDTIICHFNEEKYVDPDTGDIFAGILPELLGYHTAIGIADGGYGTSLKSFVINFTSITPKAGWGLTYENSEHEPLNADPKHFHNLSVNITSGIVTGLVTDEDDEDIPSHNFFQDNVSGLNVRATPNARYPYNYANTINPNPNNGMRYTNMPQGPSKTYRKTADNNIDYGGMMILPDSSLCVMPVMYYLAEFSEVIDSGPHAGEDEIGSQIVKNWRADGGYYKVPSTKKEEPKKYGTMEKECMLGINLNKAVVISQRPGWDDETFRFSNLSGLRVVSGNLSSIKPEMTGDPDAATLAERLPSDLMAAKVSGGLAINCGKFMHVTMENFAIDCKDYYNGGKLTIDTGDGLWDKGDNKLSVAVDETSGLTIKEMAVSEGVTKKAVSLNLDDSSLMQAYTVENEQVLRIKTLPTGKYGTGLFTKHIYDQIDPPILSKYLGINCDINSGLNISTKNELTLSLKYRDDAGHKVTSGIFYDDDKSVLSVQVNDPESAGGESHGLSINEHGTLVVSGGDGKIIFEQDGTQYIYSSENGATLKVGKGLKITPDPVTSNTTGTTDTADGSGSGTDTTENSGG